MAARDDIAAVLAEAKSNAVFQVVIELPPEISEPPLHPFHRHRSIEDIVKITAATQFIERLGLNPFRDSEGTRHAYSGNPPSSRCIHRLTSLTSGSSQAYCSPRHSRWARWKSQAKVASSGLVQRNGIHIWIGIVMIALPVSYDAYLKKNTTSSSCCLIALLIGSS